MISEWDWPYRHQPDPRESSLMRQPSPAIPKALYTVRHGVTGMRLTKPLATLVEANAAAIRLIVRISWRSGIMTRQSLGMLRRVLNGSRIGRPLLRFFGPITRKGEPSGYRTSSCSDRLRAGIA